ncbi:hypothetical protein [Hyphococcus sp.]|uniref:hypothetical protein n=1 Tax=Hyphococcus sp. TaxID=2038636 RepID=UPI003CCBD076
MLLRRITEHVKAQNWTAVALDFVIVVVGVFIGIQVANWNDARAERQDEAAILERFHDETVAAIEDRKLHEAATETQMYRMYELRKMLLGVVPPRPVTQVECTALAHSNYLPFATGAIPVLDELIATGRFGRISDPDVRQSAGALMRLRDEIRSVVDVISNSALDLPFEFPDLMRVGIEPTDAPDDIDGFVPVASCDGEAMRANQKFLNGFGANVDNYNVYYLASFIELTPSYDALHRSIDQALGMTHDAGEEGEE